MTTSPDAYIEIHEEPAPKLKRFRYQSEGRSAPLEGVNTTPKAKSFPSIRIENYTGKATAVVSCVTAEKPYRSEYGAFWKCIQAGGFYVFTQLTKMLLLATFSPDTENSLPTAANFNILAEFMRSSVDIFDLLGIAFVLSRIPGKGHSKLISAGLGWAAAEVILSRGLILWVGARGAEFSWMYIQKCLESNISLIQHLTTATLLWLFSRHDLTKSFKPVVTMLLIATAYKGLWLDGVLRILSTGPWLSLAIKALATSCMGVLSLHIYGGLAQTIGI